MASSTSSGRAASAALPRLPTLHRPSAARARTPARAARPAQARRVAADLSGAPQTLEAYVASAVNRRCAHRKSIYIQVLDSRPGRLGLGPRGEEVYPNIVERMREYLEAFYGMPAVTLPPLPMIEEAYVANRDQYDADALTDLLAKGVPADAVAYVGLTKEDLFAPGLNYV